MGIYVENEKSIRELSRNLVSDFVNVEYMTFLKDDITEQQVPFGRIGELPRFVDSLLDAYDKKRLLTWRDGSIPGDEIRVKIGGIMGKIH